ncbi:MAG: CvpA family protein [Gammaproteobacteria bacterium]|nr:CvpA family protein [Gammaproteobacteria bacterium]
MVWVDGVFIAVIILSSLVSLWRGFVREALSLATWILAFWIAWAFSDHAAPWFGTWLDTPSLQTVAGFALLFFVVLLVGAMINHFASLAIEKTGLTGTDRMIGMIFGLLRGGVLVSILVLVGVLLKLSRDPWWHESFLIPYFLPLAKWLMAFFPGNLG